jgi:hypothetical protein
MARQQPGKATELLEIESFGAPARIDAGSQHRLFEPFEAQSRSAKAVAQRLTALGKGRLDDTPEKRLVCDVDPGMCKGVETQNRRMYLRRRIKGSGRYA